MFSKNKFKPLNFDNSKFCLQNSRYFMFLSKFPAFCTPGRIKYKVQGDIGAANACAHSQPASFDVISYRQ